MSRSERNFNLSLKSGGDVNQVSFMVFKFGSIALKTSQVFYKSDLSYAFVNISPVLPGHVLIAPLRCVKRFSELDSGMYDICTALLLDVALGVCLLMLFWWIY